MMGKVGRGGSSGGGGSWPGHFGKSRRVVGHRASMLLPASCNHQAPNSKSHPSHPFGISFPPKKKPRTPIPLDVQTISPHLNPHIILPLLIPLLPLHPTPLPNPPLTKHHPPRPPIQPNPHPPRPLLRRLQPPNPPNPLPHRVRRRRQHHRQLRALDHRRPQPPRPPHRRTEKRKAQRHLPDEEDAPRPLDVNEGLLSQRDAAKPRRVVLVGADRVGHGRRDVGEVDGEVARLVRGVGEAAAVDAGVDGLVLGVC